MSPPMWGTASKNHEHNLPSLVSMAVLRGSVPSSLQWVSWYSHWIQNWKKKRKKKKWIKNWNTDFSFPASHLHCQIPFLLISSPRMMFHNQAGNGTCDLKPSQVLRWTRVHTSWQLAQSLAYPSAKSYCLKNKWTTKRKFQHFPGPFFSLYIDLGRVSSAHFFSGLKFQLTLISQPQRPYREPKD